MSDDFKRLIEEDVSSLPGEKAISICKMCGEEIEYTTTKIRWLSKIKPTICSFCDLQRKEKEKNQEIYSNLVEANLPISLEDMKKLDSISPLNNQIDAFKICISPEKLGSTSRHPYLFGKPGTGKTTLAHCYAKTVIMDLCWNIYFVNVPEFLLLLKSQQGVAYSEVVRITNYTTLVLDDFGANNITNWTLEILYNLIDRRLNGSGRVLITSNVKPTKIAKYFYYSASGNVSLPTCEAIEDRVLELSKPISVDGESIRIKKAISWSKVNTS